MLNTDIEAFEDMALRLRDCLDRAWDRLMASAPLDLLTWCPRTKANVLHDYWTALVQSEFEENAWATFSEDRGLKLLSSENFRVRFKKVRTGLLVAGNRTRRSAEWIQLPIPGITKQLNLSFVYKPDRTWSRVAVAGLSLQVGQTVPWFLEVGPAEKASGEPYEGAPETLGRSAIRVKRHVLETRQEELFGGDEDATSPSGEA